MDFTIKPADEYPIPDKLTTFSEGFYYTLQTLPTWRESEATGNGNNIRNFEKLRDRHQGNWGDPPLTVIDDKLVQYTLKRIVEKTNNKPSTVNRAVSTIKTVLNLCAKHNYIPFVPRIDRMKVEGKRPTPHYRKEQVERLIQIARERGDDTMAQAIEMSAFSGIRQAELRRLRVWDIDFHKKVFLIGGTPESRAKGRKYRAVPIHDRLLPTLEVRAASSRPMKSYIFDEYRDRYHLSRDWEKCRDRLEMEDRTIQDGHVWRGLRNSYITWALSIGIPTMTVCKWAGHASVTVTEGYYDHDSVRDNANANRM